MFGRKANKPVPFHLACTEHYTYTLADRFADWRKSMVSRSNPVPAVVETVSTEEET